MDRTTGTPAARQARSTGGFWKPFVGTQELVLGVTFFVSLTCWFYVITLEPTPVEPAERTNPSPLFVVMEEPAGLTAAANVTAAASLPEAATCPALDADPKADDPSPMTIASEMDKATQLRAICVAATRASLPKQSFLDAIAAIDLCFTEPAGVPVTREAGEQLYEVLVRGAAKALYVEEVRAHNQVVVDTSRWSLNTAQWLCDQIVITITPDLPALIRRRQITVRARHLPHRAATEPGPGSLANQGTGVDQNAAGEGVISTSFSRGPWELRLLIEAGAVPSSLRPTFDDLFRKRNPQRR